MNVDQQADEFQSQSSTSEQQCESSKACLDHNNHRHDDLADDGDDLWYDDGSPSASNNVDSVEALELDREWDRRHHSFHTAGYRDGLIAGKEKLAQVGFNEGFKQSVLVGRRFGLVRGITSALASLPDHLKEKIVEKEEARTELQNLFDHVHSMSSKDAMKLFYEDIRTNQSLDRATESSVEVNDTSFDISDCPQISKFSEELQMILELPGVHLHAGGEKRTSS